MKKLVYSLATITSLLAMLACTLFPYTHKPPETIIINNKKIINKPYDKAWNSVSNIFFQDIFKLESIDKANGIIIATFKTDRASDYVDCGIVHRKYRDNEGVVHEYSYNYADSTQYKYTKNNQTYNAKVTTDLTTEIKAKLTQMGESTKITINVSYTLNREVLSTSSLDNKELPLAQEKMQLTTSKPYKKPDFSCIANGNIESNILDKID